MKRIFSLVVAIVAVQVMFAQTVNYYVKMDGKGDGSSWEKALNGETFAALLPTVKDGAIFHMAAGTYKPVSNGDRAPYYEVNSNITIQGGYPAQPKEGATSDPSKYQAIFDGDILGDDVIDETLDENGFPSLERTNGEDNVGTMFNSPKGTSIFMLNGVIVKNAGTAVGIYHSGQSSVTLKNSSFENNRSAVILNYGGGEKKLQIYSCSFVKNTETLFAVDGPSQIVMDSVIMEYNSNSTLLNAYHEGIYNMDEDILEKDGIATLSMNRAHVTKNKGIFLVAAYNAKVENSEFVNNQVPYVFDLLGSPELQNSIAEISNCKFLQNKGEAILASSCGLSVDNCLFEGNKGSNLIQIGGISADGTPNLIENSIVKGNESTGSYGLIYCSNSSNLYMHNNHFTGNVIPESSLLYCYSLDSIAVTNSTFQETEAEHLTEFVGSRKKLFEGNTITKNNTTDYLFYLQSSSTVTTFKNNTICSNECQSSLIYSGEDPTYLYNNTIVGNKLSNTSKLITCDFYHSFVHTIGNIILGNSVPDGKTEYLAIRGGSKRDYNIMSYTEPDSSYRCHELPDASNIVSIYDLDAVDDEYSNGVLCRDFLDYASRLKYTPEEILTTLFDGTYDKKTNLFTPKLVNNGGPTSTLALKTDKLSDGTSIRFPLAGTIATDDQRGVSRLEKTCMGAYEIGCSPDTTIANDTIIAGGKFLNKTYTIVGRHDSIFETIPGEYGCDNVVMHRLVVKPDPKVKSYIVTNTKDEGEGSLRYAIEYASLSDADTFRILFDFEQPGTHVIQTGSTLSIWKRDNLIIDGSSSPDSIIIEGTSENFVGLTVFCVKNLSINSLTIRNMETGISVKGSEKIYITNCRVVENGTGIYIASTGVVVDKCLISGNKEYGIHRSTVIVMGCSSDNGGSMIKNSIIGLTDDQGKSYPNNVGIYVSWNNERDTIIGNIISGNTTDGVVLDNAKNDGGKLLRNLIGVNDKYIDFGNGGSGISYTGQSNAYNGILGNANKSDANIIGCNHEYGITSTGIVKCGVNYIGVTPDGTIIGNKKGGINATNVTADGIVISGNGGDGIHLYYERDESCYIYLENSIIGGETPQKEGNKGYGIHVENIDWTSANIPSVILYAENNTFGNNAQGGIYGNVGQILLDRNSNRSLISKNIFWGESQPFAIDFGDFNKPVIEDIIDKGDEYEIVGSVQFLDEEGWPQNSMVDTEKVGIELFWNKGSKETAYKYVGSTESDPTGKWKYNLKKTDLEATEISFISTAIHYSIYTYGGGNYTSIDNYTSALSEPYECKICACSNDTISVSDTILVGASFLGKAYTTVGVNDSIFETLKGVSGCDSIVMHKLVVKPDQKVLNYYVKTERHGTGDGSSWENAMDGKDFALYLPLAPKGATFYVAEGTYNPVYGMDLTENKSPMYTINNDVTIRGGYPANAETGAASEPDKYKTIFDGDLLGDDEYDEQLDADGYPVINKLNTTENTSTLFFSVAQGRLKARFDGVVLKNVNTAIQLINPDKKLEVLNCSFDHNVTPISLTSEKDSIYVYNSSFAKNTGNILYLPAIQDIVLDSVLFEGNASNISSSKSNFIYASFNEKNEGKEHLSMNRVRAIGNKANFNVYGYETKVENSLFEANMATDLFRVLNNNKTFEIKKSKFIQNIGKNGGIINSDEKIIIDSCLFEKNDASNWDLIGQNSTNNGLYIQHSEFLGNKATDLIKSDAKGDIVISNCNMAENQVGEYLFNIRSSESTPLYKENSICNNTAADILRTAGGTHLLENNTIASNKVTRYILEASGGNLQLNNNTIVGNNAELRLTYLLGLGLKMTGNIILGNSPEAIYLNRCNIKDSEFKYNIAPSIEFIDDLGHCESISDISSNNIFSVFSEEVTCDEFAEIPNRNEEILTTLFSGTYNSTTGLFSPEVKNNGGPTPTVALMKDILPDGTSIRFPLTETNVTNDQRGVDRLAKTCMGAYEIVCVNDTTPKNDTILVGGSFLNKAYTTVGVYDSIFETLTGEDGCDKVIMHKLVVKPDQKVLNYYVKTERHGTGDGSSWENAMNGEDFATYLPLVPNGATFYVAEGRYTPIYNMEENPSHILGDIKEYVINSSLSIIGGYPATAETGATSDPQTYHTIFTGDPSGDDVYKEGYYNSAILLDPNEDDVQVLYLFNASPSSEVYFFGCNFSGASYETTFAENKERTGATIRCDKLKLEKCDFSTFGTIQNSGSSQSTLYASECIFHNRPSISTPSSIFLYDTIHVEKSLFEDMIGTTGGVFGRVSKLADIKNSTFNNIGSSATIMERAEHIRLYNNTFVGLTADGSSNLLFSSSRANKMEIVGNIFKGCKYINLVDDASDPVHVIKNNLLENINGTDADIKVSDLKDIPLEGTYDGTDAFTPAVKNNGGFTPTIALMEDKLPDGTSIRFPLTETIVTDDQRGVKRLAKTCIGAYEIACSADTTVLSDPDVIFVGEQFLGVTYTEVGRHDSIFENLKDINGCDSVIMHTLNVQLNPDAKYYYVKTERHGTGDGSNWENAMNGEDLTTYLPLAPDGSTFYVAEGSYKPECDEDYCMFTINSNVTVRGGYPADAKTGDLSDPKKYKTVFDGDKNGDNVITKTTDETGCPVIEVENTDDDAYDMFYSSAERNLNVTFYGISIINAGHGYNAYTESEESALHLNIDNCKFENCRYGAVQSNYLGSLKAAESEFIQNGGCLLVPNVTNVEMKDVKMENNYNNYLLQVYDNSSDVNKSVTMESVTATNNTAYMQTSGNVVVSNSTFDKNSCIPYVINEQISSEKSSKIHVRNTKFTDNNCNYNLIYANNSEMTVDTSLFQNNTVTSSMIYPYSLTMDSSRVIGNKCGTGVLFEIIKDVKLTNDIINENEAETAIHIYAPTDDVVLVDQCHVESNKGRLFKHENTANGLNVTMTNSEFIGNTTDEDITWINIIGNGKDVTVLLNKNIIKDNNVSATMITSVSTDFTMSECDVNNNKAKNIMSFASSTVHIFNNALYSNQVTSNVIEANVCWDGVEIENNTIAANKSDKDLLSCYYTSTTYNNNTIVGNDVKDILFRYPYDKSFIGNIIWGNNYTELNYYNFTTTPQYNIMPLYVDRDYTQSDKVGVHIPNETNIVVDYFVDKYKTGEYEIIEEGLDAIKQYASINDIFFGTYDPSTSLFAPEIKNNGGFTPTIALKKDRLTDKTSIRFLLSETTVEQDQRGVARLVSTCMGAYEYIPSDPIECVYESILFKEDFGGNNPSDALYSENGLKEGLCSLPCAGDCPLALNDYMQTGCYALLKEAYRRQPGYRESHIYEGWYADFDDETYLGDIQRGYFMSIDMASKPTTFYQREINDLCENTNLSLSMSARPLYASDNTILYMSVEDMAGNPLTERTEVVIDKTVNEWKEYSVTFSVPQGASSVMFKIYSEGGHQGNDFALDDIIVRLCKAQVDVNRPTEPLCKHTNYTLTANYSGDPSYLEPVNYTWFRNDKETYDLDGWVKVGTGKNYELKDMTSAVNGYYRCVVSSAGVEGEMSKCNSISDIVPIFVSEYTLEKDTAHILQGETYAGVTYEKVGVFRTSNREVNEFGCDKVVNHVVFVHPGGAEYYVTMDGRSAHTGVDWDNAIDSVEFATYLPLAKAGVVFHVAEGRYRPYFNAYYEKVSKRCYYEINNNVTIIGGYAKDELDETVPSNPKKYRTVFTASSNQENNKMVESTSPRLYSMHIDNEAFVGSFRGLFIANAKAEEVKLDGIVLNYGYGFVGDHSATNLTLNRCSFEEMSDPVHYVKSLHVDTCLFRKVSIGGAPSTLFGGVATEIIIRNTTITDILGGYNDMLTCDYHGINPTLFVLENSTLVNNYAKENLIILPSSGKVRIVNNTIVNNEIGTSLSSLFNVRGNNVSTEITGNLIVGNENVSELSHVCTNTNGSIYKYNLLDLQQELPETNMKMLGRYTSILDGWNAGNRFIPTLRDNGGYTQTVALKSDRLDDGISIIRLPLEKTTVTADQRQYKRISTTCMGAYEIPLTDCEDLLDLPKEHKLTYETQYISFTVPYRCDVRVIVTDLQGRLVRDADMTYRDREGNMTVNLADLRLFELDHDPREPFIMTVKTGSKIHVTYLYITRLDKNY